MKAQAKQSETSETAVEQLCRAVWRWQVQHFGPPGERIPADPDVVYAGDGWAGWADWIGWNASVERRNQILCAPTSLRLDVAAKIYERLPPEAIAAHKRHLLSLSPGEEWRREMFPRKEA